VLGTGFVGTALAELLLEAGYPVRVWNRTPAKAQPLVAQGATLAATPAAVGAACPRVFISVMTTPIVAELIEGPAGLLSDGSLTTQIIDTTTGDPDETVALAERLARRGVCLLDVPISGSSRQIRQREGLYMAGGDRAAFAACEDLLRCLTRQYEYLGPSGSGSKAKLASNVILGLNRLALAEGLVFAEKLGLDLHAFLSLLKRSAAYSVAVDTKGRKMVESDFAPEARLRQHFKDLGIVLKYARAHRQKMPLSEAHFSLMQAAIQAGDGDLDNSAVIRELRRTS
jgi:3-hydroxyisobutyrate dehydrogenase-like beta-hydroxyacid dehydrogenase